jgi:AcrR family transcriptional regulator
MLNGAVWNRDSLMQLKTNRQSKQNGGPKLSSERRPPHSGKGAAKREQILTDLMLALADGNLRNPSLREIGQALAIEPGHLLYYFETREALLQAVIVRWDELSRELVGKSDRSLAFTLDDYAQAIARNIDRPGIVHLYLTFAAEAVGPTHPAHEFFQSRFQNLRKTLSAAIKREQSEGSISGIHNTNLQARLLIALADGLQLQSLVDPELNASADLDAALASLRHEGTKL